jgi:hypothetical protein
MFPEAESLTDEDVRMLIVRLLDLEANDGIDTVLAFDVLQKINLSFRATTVEFVTVLQ